MTTTTPAAAGISQSTLTHLQRLEAESIQIMREVVAEARHVTNRPVPMTDGPRRPGDAVKLVSGSARAGAVLGWTPDRSTMPQMIRDAWRWHQNGGYER